MTVEDIYHTLMYMPGGSVDLGKQYLNYLANDGTSYTYNTICAYDARVCSADDVSNGRGDEYTGRYSPTYSLDGWYAPEGTPEYEAAHKALDDFYGEATLCV